MEFKKADSKILTSTPFRNVLEENHEKKTIKRQKKSEIGKKARAQPEKKNSKEGSEEKESNTKVWEKAMKYKENT